MLKMHNNEVATDASLVGRLLAAQFPQSTQLPVISVTRRYRQRVLSTQRRHGRADPTHRLGCADDVHKEHYWLPRLAPLLPLAIPPHWPKGAPAQNIRGIGRFTSDS